MSDTNFTPESDSSFIDPEDVVDELDTDPEVPAHHDGEPDDLDDEAQPMSPSSTPYPEHPEPGGPNS